MPAFAAAPTTSPQWVDITASPYSADPTDTADSTTGIKAAISAAIIGGQPLYLPYGKYKVTSSLTIDFAGLAATGFRIISDGATIDGAAIGSGPVLTVQCGGGTVGSPTVCNQFKQQGTLYISAATSAYAFVFGTTNFADLQRFPQIDQLVVANSGTGGGGCQLNAVMTGQIKLACSASASGGLAGLALEQTQTSAISGPVSSNGGTALLLENGSNQRNIFTAMQFAGSSATCVSITSASALNTWISPFLSCTTAWNATLGSQNLAINPQYGASVVNIAPISYGLRVVGGSSRGQWMAPSSTTYTSTAADDQVGISAVNAGGTLNVTLPSVASNGLNSGWTEAFQAIGNAIVVSVPSGDGARILAGGHNLTSMTLPAGSNEYLKLEVNNGGNWVIVASTKATKLYNAIEGAGYPSNWTFPATTGYLSAAADNGNIFSPLTAGGNLTVTLPATGTLSQGWSIGLATDNAFGITAQVSNGHIIFPGSGCLSGCVGVTSLTVPGGLNSNYELVVLQYDGSNFRVTSATPGAAQALGMNGGSAFVVGNTALGNLPAAVTRARRLGYYVSGDASGLDFTLSPAGQACSLNAGSGDGGMQVASAISGRCWNAVVPDDGGLSVKEWGVTGSATVAAGTTHANNATINLDQAWDFQNGQNITIVGAGAPAGVGTPPTPTLSVIGPTGSSTYCERIAYIGSNMQIGAASAEVCTFIGNAVLDTVPDLSATEQGLAVSWPTPSNAVLGVVVYEGPSGGEQFVGIAAPGGGLYPGSGQWNFYGVNVQNRPSWVPNLPLTSSQSQALTTTIQSGAGTTALTVSPAPQTTVNAQPAWHDETAALSTALADYAGPLKLGPGSYTVTGALTSALNGQRLVGCGRGCANVVPQGAFDLFSLANPNGPTGTGTRTSPPTPPTGNEGQEIQNLAVAGIGHVGWSFKCDANRAKVSDIWEDQPFDQIYIGGPVPVQDCIFERIWTTTETRGNLGVELDGSGTFAALGKVILPWLNDINLNACFNCTGLWITGNVASLQSTGFVAYQSPYTEILIDNSSNATFGPKLGVLKSAAANVCWHLCLDVKGNSASPQATSDGFTFDDVYFQSHRGGNSSAVLLESNTTHMIFNGGHVFGSSTDLNSAGADIAGFDDFGFGSQINGVTIYAFAGEAVICESGANTQVNGGADFHFLGQVAYASGTFGILLRPGCSGASIKGQWIGQQGDVVDQSGNPYNNTIEGRPPGSIDTEIAVTANMTLSVSGGTACTSTPSGGTGPVTGNCASLYNNSLPGCGVGYLSPGGSIHFDTAANIASAMGADGSRMCLILKNEKNPLGSASIVINPASGDSANLNLNHGSAVTIPPGDQVVCIFSKPTSGSPTLVATCLQ